MASSTASSLGGLAGSIYGPVGSAIGTAAGGMVGGTIAAIPELVVSDAERENKRRIEELKRMQEMGTLGLSEREKQQLYGAGQSQIQGRLQQAGQIARQAGAAGMATGAGTELLRAAQSAETGAGLAASIAQSVGEQDLARKRELQDEMISRQQAASQMKTDRLSAITKILTGGLGAGTEALTAEQTYGGKQIGTPEISAATAAIKRAVPGATDAETNAFIQDAAKNPELFKYLTLFMGTK